MKEYPVCKNVFLCIFSWSKKMLIKLYWVPFLPFSLSAPFKTSRLCGMLVVLTLLLFTHGHFHLFLEHCIPDGSSFLKKKKCDCGEGNSCHCMLLSSAGWSCVCVCVSEAAHYSLGCIFFKCQMQQILTSLVWMADKVQIRPFGFFFFGFFF